MAADFGIVYPLWAMTAAGDGLLDRALGEIPLSHITVPVVTGPTARFRVNATGPHEFATAGGWHFPPRADCYRSRTVRPHAADWFERRNQLARLVKEVQKRDLRWLARIDLRSVPTLLHDSPHLAQVNAWGEPAPQRGPCVLQPELGELLEGLLEDLQGYEMHGLELIGWILDAPVHSEPLLDWNAAARQILNTCFCSACRRIAELAGIDCEMAQRSAQVEITRLLSSGLPSRPSDDPLLFQYRHVRQENADAWLSRLAKSKPELQQLIAREVTSPAIRATPPGWQPLLMASYLAEGAPIPPGMPVSLACWRPQFNSSDDFVARVHELASSGTPFIEFDGLDAAGEEAVDWIRRAVRFAHREISP